MSPSIWTQCAGDSSVGSLDATPWRAVEAQHQVSTRKLVDSLDEQALLEALIDTAKPPDLVGGRLHYLLSTPFRYPPLRHGSRFGTRRERGIWYGSEDQRTLFAEVAYYRLVFLDGTRADIDALTTWHTAFTVPVRTRRGVDLTKAPFDAHGPAIAARDTYALTQQLGRDMRTASVEAFRYPSARDAEGGVNIGVLAAAAFAVTKPRTAETWHCTASRDRVEFVRRDLAGTLAFSFVRDQFQLDGVVPAPAV
jgi:hypothetical protein